MQKISDWNGAAGGTRDNYPELLAKCKANFEELAGSFPTPENVAFFDHFMGDVLADQWHVIAGSDSPAAGALVESVGGKLRLTTGDSNASLAADGVQVTSFLNYSTGLGLLRFQAKLQVSAITNLQLFAGFTDQRAALEMPVTLSTVTFTTVASNAVGFLFDTAATTDTIRLVGVATDVDAVHQDTGLAPVAATDLVLRIDVDRNGTATFYIDGVQVGTALLAAVTPETPLAIVVAARAAGDTVSKTVDIDYLGASMAA
jgi:hypothetical protein